MTNGSNIYAGSSFGGIYFSSNGGSNWAGFNSGISSLKISCLISDNGTMYAATSDSGLFRYESNTWKAVNINSGITYTHLTCLYADSTNIYIGTDRGTIYKGPKASIIGIKKIENSMPQKFSLNQNYPNPFNP